MIAWVVQNTEYQVAATIFGAALFFLVCLNLYTLFRWASANPQRMGYTLPVLIWLTHEVIFYGVLILFQYGSPSVTPQWFGVWSSLRALHGQVTILAILRQHLIMRQSDSKKVYDIAKQVRAFSGNIAQQIKAQGEGVKFEP